MSLISPVLDDVHNLYREFGGQISNIKKQFLSKIVDKNIDAFLKYFEQYDFHNKNYQKVCINIKTEKLSHSKRKIDEFLNYITQYLKKYKSSSVIYNEYYTRMFMKNNSIDMDSLKSEMIRRTSISLDYSSDFEDIPTNDITINDIPMELSYSIFIEDKNEAIQFKLIADQLIDLFLEEFDYV